MTVKQKLAMAAVGLMAFAQAGEANMMNGMYVGVQGGLSYMNHHGKNASQLDITDADTNYFWKNKKRNTSVEFGALVGREMYRLKEDMPVSAEFSVRYNTGAAKEKASPVDATGANAINQSARVRQTWTLGLSALIGKEITNDLTASFKLGVVYSNFNAFLGLDEAEFDNRPLKGQNIRLFGIEPGVRMAYKINDCMSAHIEGTYAMYQGKKKSMFFSNADEQAANVKIAPRIWGLKVGVTHKI